MNIKELFNKLFKSGTKTYGLALPTDLVSVPMRDRLDDEKIKELEEYKANYFRLLEQKKHFTSHDISSKDFSQEMLMNFELFGRLVIAHDNNYNLDTMKDYEKDELWLKQKINPRKIKLYIDKMEAMFNETHLRLVALKEIYSESGKRLSRDKQSAILNEIYNLTSKYIIFKNNVYAALKEVETYEKELSYNQNTPDVIDQKHVLSKHSLYLSYYASILIPNKLYELKKNNLDEIEKIAYLERELEIYAYNHLKIDDLNQELEAIDKIEKAPKNRQMLLDKINELEIKYLVLNDYGGHELDLKPLYEVKFDILTIDIVRQENSPFWDVPGREFKYYEDILLNKLTINITGTDSLLSQRLDGDKEVIPSIVRILKYDNYGEILINKFKLSLILSMESDEKAKYFFDNYMVDLYHENIVTTSYLFVTDRYSGGKYSGFNYAFTFKNCISLSGACRAMRFYDAIGSNKIDSSKTQSLLEIYEYLIENSSNNRYDFKLPEGLKKIDTDYLMHFEEDEIRNYLCNLINNKTIIMPSTLEYLDVGRRMFDGVSIPKIILNEGLKVFKGNLDFGKLKTKSITIPSTLLNINENDSFFLNSSILENVNEYVFTNFEISNILNDEKSRRYILRGLCKRAYSNFRVMSNPGIYIHEINHNPRNIVLVSSDGTRHTISINQIVRENLLKEVHDTGLYSTKGKIVVTDQGRAIKASTNEIESEIENLMKSSTKKR